MQTLQKSYRGLGLLMELNWDRILYLMTVLGALWLGAFIGSL